MRDVSLLNAYETGELSDQEVLANLPAQFADRNAPLLSVRGILALIDRYGGRGVYVPRNPGTDHGLGALLSVDDLKVLARHYGGGYFTNIPAAGSLKKHLRAKRIISMRASGNSVRQVAEALGVTERWVQAETARYRSGM